MWGKHECSGKETIIRVKEQLIIEDVTVILEKIVSFLYLKYEFYCP
jgi:hypothetical protein